MTERLVTGLFQSSGIALDAYHRLRTEGIPASRLAYRVLEDVGVAPPTVRAEIEALAIDPMVWGDVRGTFAPLIHNGETAVFVRVGDQQEEDLAAGVLRLYMPLAIETVYLRENPQGAPKTVP